VKLILKLSQSEETNVQENWREQIVNSYLTITSTERKIKNVVKNDKPILNNLLFYTCNVAALH
jgi:6-phosphogluconate dehydrogenase